MWIKEGAIYAELPDFCPITADDFVACTENPDIPDFDVVPIGAMFGVVVTETNAKTWGFVDLVQTKLQEIDGAYEAMMQSIKQGYTQTEIETWFKQTAEVDAYLVDNSAATPMIDHLLPEGVPKADFVAVIKAKSDQYAEFCGDFLKHKRSLHAQVLSIKDDDNLSDEEKAMKIVAVNWELTDAES